MDPKNPIQDGRDALRRGQWEAARALLGAALETSGDPELHDLLGIALWWLNEIPAAHDHRRRAYLGYRQLGRRSTAARIAAWIAREQVFLDGNTSAMEGWFARAERLLDRAEPSVEAHWVALYHASMTAPPLELARVADDALVAALDHADADLELLALAFHGIALVTIGRVDEGMAHLDEAMAAATAGEARDLMVASEIFCVTLSACEVAGDLVRTEHWCRVAAAFAERHGCPFLSAYCRTTYGGLLVASGRWLDAETTLLEAIDAFEQGHRALRIHAILKLADLRVSQGRLEEAQQLLTGLEDHPGAVVPLARFHLALGDDRSARTILEHALERSGPPTLDQLPLLSLLATTYLANGDHLNAERITQSLVTLANQSDSDLLIAQAALTRGRLEHRLGTPGARRHYDAALERLQRFEQSLLAGRVKLELARSLTRDDPPGARAWARAALATFERVGAIAARDEAAALLRELGVAGPVGRRTPDLLTPREMEVLALLAYGLSNREIAERLVISVKTVESHVSRILGKLGFRSRTEAGAYAARHRNTEGRPIAPGGE